MSWLGGFGLILDAGIRLMQENQCGIRFCIATRLRKIGI